MNDHLLQWWRFVHRRHQPESRESLEESVARFLHQAPSAGVDRSHQQGGEV